MRNRKTGLTVLALLLAMSVFAQNNTGIISGKITDQTGATVPNAQVTITQTDTGVNSVSQSNSEGIFRVPGLRDGLYRVSVTAAGFKKEVREGISLQIGQIMDVEIKLEVGATNESITVSAASSLIDTQTSSTGQVLEGDYFYQLPNYQHWEKGVLYYTPQVESSNAPWPGALGNWNINGANSYQTAQYEDGMLATSMDGGTTINSVSVADEEVKVLTSAMPAEYGHATSGALIVVKKGGTNEFHGQGGELFKNNPLVERRFFQLQTNPQQGVSDLFQMPDFVLSGPVLIPHFYNGKNRTFFEIGGSYHVDTSSNASSYSTPTAAMLSGNFSAFSNTIYDPASTSGSFAAGNLSRSPFPGNIIPQNRFSTMWNAIAANNPFAPPQAGAGSITPTGPNGNIVASGSGSYFNLTNQVRLDHSFTDKLKIMGSVTWGNQHQPQNNANISYAPYDQYQVLTYTVQNVAAVNFTYTITPNLISETRVGEYRRTGNPRSLSGEDYTFALSKTVPNLPSNVYVNPIGFGLTEGTNGSNQLGVGTLSVQVNNNHQLNQDFTMIKGKHSFKFGYEWLWENEVAHNIGNARLTLGFGQGGNAQTDGTTGIGPTGTQLPNTGGIQLANIMLGYVTSYSYNQQGASLLPVDSNQSGYFQDDWRILPNLTLNLGLRYENETPAHSKFPGQLSVGSLTAPDNYYTSGSVPGLLTCPAGGCVGGWIQPKGFLWNRDNKDFQPRFGLAWTVNPTTVVRGGFALMTLDWNLGYTAQNEIGGANFYNQSVSQPANSYTPLFNINQGVPSFVSVATLPNGEIPTSASSPSARPTITVYPANYHHPYTLNWNLTIQHQLKKDYLLEVSYVGLHNIGFGGTYNWDSRPYGTGIDPNGNVIDLTQQANWAYRNTWVSNTSGVNGTQAYKPYPNLGGVNYECNCVRMIYHSGTIKIQKRYSNGLTFLAFATMQKGIQNSPGNLYLNQQEQRAVTGMTQKYRFVSSMTYEMPFGKGKALLNKGGILDRVVGGWSFAWNFSVWAPTPASIGYSGGNYLNPVTGALGGRQDYPNYEPEPGGGIYLLKDPQLRQDWQNIGTNRFVQTAQNPIVTNCGTAPIINPNGSTFGNQCEEVAPSFTNGNLPGNEWIEQRIIGANASMYKDFRIKERFKAQIRLDYFNPFKWFNWSQANTTMTQTNPATFMTPGLNDNGDSTEGGPSEMQLSFRIRF
jgi:Carboxypeptidase regulatory-like domain